MRCHYGGWFRDGAGKVVLEGTVKIYLEGGDIEADIYSTFASTTKVHAVSSSATDGTFEFWISRFDYDTDQRFKLVLSKLGYTTKTYDNISVDDVVLDTYVIAADTTVTTQLQVPKGVIYQIATGKTLTISGIFEAGLYQVFDCVGTGAVSFGVGSIKESYPQWWVGGTSSYVTLADSATPSIQTGALFLTGGTTTITNFTTGFVSQKITVIAEHSITITDGTNIFLNGSANFQMTATDTLTLIQKADGKWYELSRGDNGV